MNSKTWHARTLTRDPQYGRCSTVLLFLLVVILSFSPSVIAQVSAQTSKNTSEPGPQSSELAQDFETLEQPVELVVLLPDSFQMAMALASPGLREPALLDLAVAANVLIRAKDDLEVNHTTLAKVFLDDRAWLQMLVDRYGWVQPRSSVLDPAAWLVLEELQLHDFEDMTLVFPGRTPWAVLNDQVFQRSAERLAEANLPILLLKIEADATSIWEEFLQLTMADGSRHAAWKGVEDAWFTGRQFPSPKDLQASVESRVITMESITSAMSNLVLSAVDSHPPDYTGLIQLRYAMLSDVPALTGEEYFHFRDQVGYALYLVSLIDGLQDGHYFYFVQGLLSITSRLLELSVDQGLTYSLVDWLVAELPAISAHYAVGFANVDPGLNAAMAAVYEVLSNIASANEQDTVETDLAVTDATGADSVGDETAEGETPAGDSISNQIDVKASRAILANAVAQLALLIPDMGYYFDTPVRARIVEEINICISIAASLDDNGGKTMTRRQYDACMETLLQLAEEETRLAELSGNMNGPFTTDTLRRELTITPWQRINYVIGYLHEQYSTACQPPANPLPNPLEWAVLATTMTWFAGHSPEFINTPENETRLTKMRNMGEQLILGLAEQSACLASAGTGINDPVSRGMTDYELALRELDLGIEQAEADFREERLSPGADVVLDQDATQRTSYRPDGLLIEPCDKQAVCEMSGNLSTTRALIGLFPDEYLIAEQTGMGQIEICYRSMEWVQRRSELVRADDDNVSNYFGHLGFDLVGRYVENNQARDIFGFRFTSPEEHHYLFAQTSEDVLNDSCPVEWVGSRVVTPLRENRGGIVPDRLTYLAASRSLPSRLLQNNWDRGAEWRDWFVTGIGVSSLDVSNTPDIKTKLNLHLQSLYQVEQAGIYQRVLLPSSRNSLGEDVSLFDEMSQVSIAKALVRMQLMLFYPESLFNSDKIRTAIAGNAGLLEGRSLRRFREDNVALTSVNRIAHERLDELRKVWLEQPEAVRQQGSVPATLMHAMTRIQILYRQFFTSRPEPIQEIEVTAKQRIQERLED